jgi:hypothetical protein
VGKTFSDNYIIDKLFCMHPLELQFEFFLVLGLRIFLFVATAIKTIRHATYLGSGHFDAARLMARAYYG